MRCISAILLLAAMPFASGCQDSSNDIGSYSKRRLTTTSQDDAYEAALTTMREYFRVDVADRARGIIRSTTSISAADTSARPLGKSLSTQRTARRIAEFRVLGAGDATTVACRVVVQEQDTAEQRTFYRHQTSADDTPGQTPLEESGGLDEEGYATWSTTGYDRALERELLAALAERLSQGNDK